MKKILIAIIMFISFILPLGFSFSVENPKNILDDVADNRAGSDLDSSSVDGFMKDIAGGIIMPLIIVIGLIIAFVGFYKLAFSDKEDERKAGINYALWGTIGVIIMTSAGFLVNTLVGGYGSSGILGSGQDYDPASIAAALYEDIIKNFFILAMYFVVGILFIILVINLIKFLASGDKEDVKKHAKTIVIWNSLGIVFIMFAKNIVEMFYSQVQSGAYSLGDQGAILETRDIGWIATVLNYLLGFIAFILTAFIIYQSFLLLMKPDDESTYKNLKKYFLYAILGVLIIGGVYIIANFFIIN